MRISIVIPVRDVEEATDNCISHIINGSSELPEIIVIDNGSEKPYKHNMARTIRNENNIGFWPSMLQGIQAATSEIVLCMHNDVFIYERGFDQRIIEEFNKDPLLGIAGFFGARGVAIDGGRLHPESQMLGLQYGTPWYANGALLTGSNPAVVFDSLAMIFRKPFLYNIDYNVPPHHWTDRLITLRMVLAGYHAITIGIQFDHGGSWTPPTTLDSFAENYCKEHNIPFANGSWNMSIYEYGKNLFAREFNRACFGATRLHVKEDFTLEWS